MNTFEQNHWFAQALTDQVLGNIGGIGQRYQRSYEGWLTENGLEDNVEWRKQFFRLRTSGPRFNALSDLALGIEIDSAPRPTHYDATALFEAA